MEHSSAFIGSRAVLSFQGLYHVTLVCNILSTDIPWLSSKHPNLYSNDTLITNTFPELHKQTGGLIPTFFSPLPQSLFLSGSIFNNNFHIYIFCLFNLSFRRKSFPLSLVLLKTQVIYKKT